MSNQHNHLNSHNSYSNNTPSNNSNNNQSPSNNELIAAKFSLLGGILSTLGDALATIGAAISLEELEQSQRKSSNQKDNVADSEKIKELEKQIKYLMHENQKQKLKQKKQHK